MSSSLQARDHPEEQDIGLYYQCRRGSPAFSDTDDSMSRPVSQVHLEVPDAAAPHALHASLKSPSLSQVAEAARKHRRLSVHQPIVRSRTVPDLPSTASANSESGLSAFVFSEERVKKMQEWVLGFAVVHFDLDLGPVVRAMHPPMHLSPSEAENIAFSSFPDSFLFEQGSEVHSFRIKAHPETALEDIRKERRPRSLDGFMYGFSHFSQKRDPTSKRGYQQSSLVLLTLHQYPALYTSMISKLGPLFHSHGTPMLETACHNIASWQGPSLGSTLELGFLGSVLHIELPLDSDNQQPAETGAFNERFNPGVHLLVSSGPFEPPPIQLFETSLSHLWSVWECLVLCEPILVFGPSPSMTSQAVWWLRDLMRPMPLATDIRPYFTIHDKDHAMLVNKAPPRMGLLIGVTNPFFGKSCAHWPHVLSVGRKGPSRASSTVVTGPPPGWTTKTHRRHISKDRQLLKALEKACTGHEAEQMQASLDMRRHFGARTNAMFVPLNRYLNTLMPSASERHAGKARLKRFSVSDFLASLQTSPSGLPFTSSAKQKAFYDKWFRSPAFGLWLARQEEVVGAVLSDTTRVAR